MPLSFFRALSLPASGLRKRKEQRGTWVGVFSLLNVISSERWLHSTDRSCLLFRSPRPSSVTATVKGLLAWLIHSRLICSPEYKQLKVANDLLAGLNQCSFTPFDIQKIFHTPGESSVPARGFSVTQHLESNRFLFNFPNMKFYIILNLFHGLNMLSRPARGSNLT